GNWVGLFNLNTGRLANLTLESIGASVAHPANMEAGSLAALNLGHIDNVRIRNGQVSGAAQRNLLGGLVARNYGSIANSTFQGRINGSRNTYAMGGLAGYNGSQALIAASSADMVLGGQPAEASAGALVGVNAGG
ncbi:GLUG motif-containing protein, partial [Pseudomonas paraeruginosa]